MTRSSKNKPTKFKVAIVGEGETEWYYFSYMKQNERFSFKVEPDLPKHSDYKTIIETARKKRDEGYDLTYCVLDLDRIITNDTERTGYLAEKSKTKANRGIRFIETMPCIELWFLLHFLEKYSSKIYLDFEQISIPLKKHIPKYEKSAIFFKSVNIYDYLNKNGNFIIADEYAIRLAKEKDNSDNPYYNFSSINILIKELKEL